MTEVQNFFISARLAQKMQSESKTKSMREAG